MIYKSIAAEIVADLAKKVMSPNDQEGGAVDKNPWRYRRDVANETPEDSELRRNNLERFLTCRKVALFVISDVGSDADVGETGIPIVSPFTIAAGRFPRVPSTSLGARIVNPREPTAINDVWTTLTEYNIHRSTITWNAYPFVPTQHRQPSPDTLAQHLGIIEPLLAAHPKAQICTLNAATTLAFQRVYPALADRVINLNTQRAALGSALQDLLTRMPTRLSA